MVIIYMLSQNEEYARNKLCLAYDLFTSISSRNVATQFHVSNNDGLISKKA